MRKITLILMMLFMVMPSLVCFMPLCSMSSAQASEIVGQLVPCHEQVEDSKSANDGVMLIQDCMGVDFQKASTAQVIAPDLATSLVVYAPFTMALVSQLTQIDSNVIRGPPLDADIVAISVPVYQTTQRFRL